LLDALLGDAALFIRSDAIERSWHLIDAVLEAWESGSTPPLASYERGSWGPTEAEALIDRDGHAWLRSCGNHHEATSGNGNK